MTEPETPELDRQVALIRSGRAETVQEFIDWLAANGYAIARRCTYRHGVGGSPLTYCPYCHDTGLMNVVWDFGALMAEHFGIDQAKVEAERRALLDHMREEA